MDKIIVNDTPVRTSNHFGMNHLVLENIEIPIKIQDFQNLKVENGKQVEIIKEKVEYEVKYGVGKKQLQEIKEKANQRIKLHIKENVKEPIRLVFTLDEKNPSLVDDIYIEIEENIEAKVFIQYQSEKQETYYHNGICKVIAKKNSHLQLGIVNLVNQKSNQFYTIDSESQENAKIETTLIELGGKNNVSNWYTKTTGEKAISKLETIYLGMEDQLIDLNYIGELYAPKTQIKIEIQGALKDRAKKNFKGTIDFKTGAKQSKGAENESCMLLSEKAKSKALPMLLCTEDDVEGEHSTGSGKIENKQLFYIMSRGFSKKEAIKLIVRAKFDKILNHIGNKEEILEEIDKRLD